MMRKIKSWYEGTYIPAKNDPNGSFWMMGYYERHWTARAVSWALSFWMREWKWIIGTAIAVTGIIIGYKKL